MSANDKQVDGSHYRQEGTVQHWDFAASQNFDYFQGQITKYVTRWKKKNGLKDLEKALHFLEKYIEVEKAKVTPTSPTPLGVVWNPNYKIARGELPPVVQRDNYTHGYDPKEELGVKG